MKDGGFIITCWGGIPKRFVKDKYGKLDERRYAEMKEAGLDLVPVSGYGVEAYDKDTVRLSLAACEKFGLKAQLADPRISRALSDPENRRKLLSSVVSDFSTYPALFSYYVTDEPKCGAFADVADVCRILRELDPAHETHVNVLGNRAYEPYWGCKTYGEYLTRYMETVAPDIISYDNYHFKKGAEVTDQSEHGVMFDGVLRKKIDLPGFLGNFETARIYSKRYGVPFMTVVLVLEHVDYRDLTEAELRYEVFTSLCSGAKRISYFTYWEPYGDRDENWEHIVMLNMRGSMIERSGTRSAHYEQIKRINRDLRAIGDIVYPHGVKDVFHIGAEPDENLTYWKEGHGGISSVKADKAMLGFFDNGCVVAVNKDYENEGRFIFASDVGKKLLHYDKTFCKWEPSDGKVTVGPGDGELLRIVSV